MARHQKKIIISCAMTGGIHTPTMSPALPVTPDEIARTAAGAGYDVTPIGEMIHALAAGAR